MVRYRSSAAILMIFGVVLLSVLASMFYAFGTGLGFGEQLLVHSERFHHIHLNLALSHLWLEEIITGDESVDEEHVLELLDVGSRLADQMLEDPSVSRSADLPILMSETASGIKSFRAIAVARLAKPEESGAGTAIDQATDIAFAEVTNTLGNLEAIFTAEMDTELNRFRRVRSIIIILIALLLTFAAAFLWRFLKDNRNARDALQESEFKFRSIIESSPLGMLMYRLDVDDTLILTGANPAANDILGINLEPEYGKALEEVFPPLAETEIPGRYRESARTGKSWHWDEVDYDYEEVRGAYDVYAFQTSQNSMVASFLDITDRKRAAVALERLNEELSSKKVELEQLLYVATHDLRSPLVNIQGFGRELERAFGELKTAVDPQEANSRGREAIAEIIDEDMAESLSFIRASIDKMDRLLSGLLRLSRLGRTKPVMGTVDMDEVMRKAAENFRFLLDEHKISLDVGEMLPAHGDADRLGQVFSNLLDNAIKYRNHERPCEIRIECRKESDDTVVYSVIDNGKGIAPEHHQRIFDIFHRLEPGESVGEGLGLTIIRRILDGHRGRIKVESEPGAGARFDVYLPSKEPE